MHRLLILATALIAGSFSPARAGYCSKGGNLVVAVPGLVIDDAAHHPKDEVAAIRKNCADGDIVAIGFDHIYVIGNICNFSKQVVQSGRYMLCEIKK